MIFVAFTTSNQAQSLDQQERGAEQAPRAFQLYVGSNRFSTGHQSHYNTKLGKCLMLVSWMERIDNGILSTTHLGDANEGRGYAYFRDHNGVMSWCTLTPSLRVTRFCHSREEFDDFIASYMEQ
jgi:hypothetical protein